ncbi:MAG: hypothetical protein RL607_1873 [Bacteroidota bacterium]|jgi:hypothetical protein
MYGIFINSIKDYIIQNFGIEVWEQICLQVGLEEDFFINAEFYPVNLLENIIKAILEFQNRTAEELFYEIGFWWALHSVPKLYLGAISKGADHFKKFLLDFPLFINRMALIYPNLSFTEFKSYQISENEIQFLHLPIKLKKPEFTKGILMGFGALFEATFELTLVQIENEQSLYNEYKITFTA